MTQTTSCREMMNHSTILVLLGSSKELIEKSSSISLASDNVYTIHWSIAVRWTDFFHLEGHFFGKIPETDCVKPWILRFLWETTLKSLGCMNWRPLPAALRSAAPAEPNQPDKIDDHGRLKPVTAYVWHIMLIKWIYSARESKKNKKKSTFPHLILSGFRNFLYIM